MLKSIIGGYGTPKFRGVNFVDYIAIIQFNVNSIAITTPIVNYHIEALKYHDCMAQIPWSCKVRLNCTPL